MSLQQFVILFILLLAAVVLLVLVLLRLGQTTSAGVSAAQVILRWDLQRSIVVIPGSSNPDHIKENLDLFEFELTDAEMEQVGALDRDEKHDWY